MGEREEILTRIDAFVAATRTAVFVRRADNLLLIRPEKTLGINESGAAIVEALYDPAGRKAAEALAAVARRFGVGLARVASDAFDLLQSIAALMRDDFSPRPNLRFGPFDRGLVRYPILAEIALTYGCQNRCTFCYAASPFRAGETRVMTTDEVKRVMKKVFDEAHCPSLSFTGGEATLRPDLPELVRYGKETGFRVNLITNGIRAADEAYARTLVEAGLASAQVSIEAAEARLHDELVGREGAFEKTVQGVRNFQRLGIHVHTNTTLCRGNLDAAPALIRFVARDLGNKTLSMNMLIRTGMALDPGAEPVTYTEIGRRLPGLLDAARAEGVRLVWYSPIPYCIANPVLLGQGAKSCACVDGILSVNPAGEVLPCSSFRGGIGSLLTDSYETVRKGRAAAYWHNKEFVPPVCAACPDVDVCAGACPLYWDAAGGFGELPRPGAEDAAERRHWEERRRDGGSYGVPAPPFVEGGGTRTGPQPAPPFVEGGGTRTGPQPAPAAAGRG